MKRTKRAKTPPVRVFSNLAVSIDGKIADTATPNKPLGTPLDRATMQVVRRQADVVVVGGETLRVHRKPLRVKGRRLANAVVTASGRLDPEMPWWDASDVVRFVFTTQAGLETALLSARDRAIVVVAGETSVDPIKVVERLKASGLTQMLVEGGGGLMASFLAARCLHEMFVTVTPWALGGPGPTMVTGDAPLAPWASLEILSHKRVKNEIYLRYGVKGARRV